MWAERRKDAFPSSAKQSDRMWGVMGWHAFPHIHLHVFLCITSKDTHGTNSPFQFSTDTGELANWKQIYCRIWHPNPLILPPVTIDRWLRTDIEKCRTKQDKSVILLLAIDTMLISVYITIMSIGVNVGHIHYICIWCCFVVLTYPPVS